MKFASFALASSLLLMAIAPAAQAQTANQYQHQLNRAVCLNNWTEAIGIVRMLLGSEQITPQQRQQLLAFRSQLEQHQTNNSVFDRAGDPNCAAAIAAAPREAAALQAPSPRRPVQPAAPSRPIARTPQPAANRPIQIDWNAADIAMANASCQALRMGLGDDAATVRGADAYRDYLIDRYGFDVALNALEVTANNLDRRTQDWTNALLRQCPELL